MEARDASATTSHSYRNEILAVPANGVAMVSGNLKQCEKRASLAVGPRGPGRRARFAMVYWQWPGIMKPRNATAPSCPHECKLVDRRCRPVFERTGVADWSISSVD